MRSANRIFTALLMLFTLAAAALACCGDDPVTVDLERVSAHIARSGLEPIEGLWDVRFAWHPWEGAPPVLQMAIVKNEYKVYKNSAYLGVAMHDVGAYVAGEIAMLFTDATGEGEFGAVVVTPNGYGRGQVQLVADARGRKDGALDMSDVRYSTHTMLGLVPRAKGH